MAASDPLSLAPDVRRAVVALGALALVAFVLSALYAFPAAFQGPLGRGLPDVSPTAGEMVDGFQVLAALSIGWAVLLIALSTPAVAGALRQRLSSVASGEARWTWAVAAVLAVGYAWARIYFTQEVEGADMAALAAGEGTLPFQFRALVPVLVGVLAALPGAQSVPLAAWYGGIEALAAFGAWAAFRRLVGPHIGGRARASVVALALFVPLALGLASPWRYNALYFPWDTVSVAVFALGLALIQERRWTAFYVLFALGTLNRETTCFLTIALVLEGLGRQKLGVLAMHGAAQLAIWLGIKAGLAWAYGGNALAAGAETGGLFMTTYVRSVAILTAVPGLVYLGLAMGGVWIVALLLRQRLDPGALSGFARMVPVFLLGMVFVGELMEVRIYAELMPLATAALVVQLASVVREVRLSPEAVPSGVVVATG